MLHGPDRSPRPATTAREQPPLTPQPGWRGRSVPTLLLMLLFAAFGAGGNAGLAAAEDGTSAPADGGFHTLDLRPLATMGWKDDTAGDGKGGWTDQGANDMRNVVPGRQVLLGVPFDLIDAASNGGKAVITLRSTKFNAGVPDVTVPVGRTAMSIYFLHASAWSGGHMATYTVQYQDGTSVAIPIRAGQEINDWWSPQNGASCRVALHVPNGQTDDVGLLVFGWANPAPAKPIASILIHSEEADGIVVLTAITCSDKPLTLPDPKDIPTPTYLQSDLSTLDTSQWFPVEIKTDPFQPTCIDQLAHLDAPAGKHGFQKTVDGHWAFADGTPCHFCGTMANPPATKAECTYLARFLAKYGFTLVRVGHLVTGPADDSIIDWKQPDTQHFNAAYLDRLDFFIGELAKNGIYTRISTMWYRKMKKGDGIPGFDAAVAYAKHLPLSTVAGPDDLLDTCGITFYQPDVMRLNIALLTTLMRHQNPYRNNTAYGADPAIAQLEVTNEDGVFFYTLDHPAPQFAAMLDQQWVSWLTTRYGDDAHLQAAWGDELGGSESLQLHNVGRYNLSAFTGPSALSRPKRLADQVHFYADLENRYFTSARDALRAAGAQQPVCGSGWFGAGSTFFADIWANAQGLDYIDRHHYWAGGPGDWQILPGMTFNTECALKQPELLLKLGSERVMGMPFTISEWANVLPNQFRLEAPPLMAFYGNELGGWDAPMHFAWGGGGFCEFLKWMWPVNEASTLCQYPALSQMIRQGDIKQGPDAFVRNLSDAKVLSGKPLADVLVRLDISGPFAAMSSAQGSSASALAAVYAGAVGRTGIAFTGAVEKPDASLDLNRYIDTAHGIIHAATGELTWNYGQGYVTAAAPRMQAAVGFFPNIPISLPDCTITTSNSIASVLVVPLDDAPLATSRHLLITAVGRCRNTGMAYSQGGQRLLTLGSTPTLLEGVKGTVSLKRTGTCHVVGLDTYGYKSCDVIPVIAADHIDIPMDGRNHAAYYEVTCE